MNTESTVRMFTVEEMLAMLPVILSDLKYASTESERALSNENIRRSMYFHVIRELHDPDRFAHEEPVGEQKGLFIKGYVRDVWAYLQSAYDLIHRTDFVSEFAELIAVSD